MTEPLAHEETWEDQGHHETTIVLKTGQSFSIRMSQQEIFAQIMAARAGSGMTILPTLVSMNPSKPGSTVVKGHMYVASEIIFIGEGNYYPSNVVRLRPKAETQGEIA